MPATGVATMSGPSEILIARNDRLGDWVLTLPLMDLIKRARPDGRLDAMCQPAVAPLLRRSAAIDDVLTCARHTPASILATAREVRRRRYAAAVVVHPDLTDTLVMWWAGVPCRSGNGYRAYAVFYNRPVRFHRGPSDRHEVEYNLNFLAALDIAAPAEIPDPHIDVTAADRDEAAALLAAAGLAGREYIVVHPGSGGSSLNWSRERYRTLVNELARTTGLAVVVTGGPAEAELAAFVAGPGAGRASLAGQTTFGALVGILAGARLFISGNTGPMHVAAAAGAPTLALFTPLRSGSPVRWGPRTRRRTILQPAGLECEKCPRSQCPHFNCMEALTVEEVWGAARRMIGSG